MSHAGEENDYCAAYIVLTNFDLLTLILKSQDEPSSHQVNPSHLTNKERLLVAKPRLPYKEWTDGDCAIRNGHFSLCLEKWDQHLKDYDGTPTEQAVAADEFSLTFSETALDEAVSFGRTDFMNWLATTFDLGCKDTTLVEACRLGDLDSVKFLCYRYFPYAVQAAVHAAAAGGQCSVLQWLCQGEHSLSSDSLKSKDQTEIRHDLIRNYLNMNTVAHACFSGNIDTIEFVLHMWMKQLFVTVNDTFHTSAGDSICKESDQVRTEVQKVATVVTNWTIIGGHATILADVRAVLKALMVEVFGQSNDHGIVEEPLCLRTPVLKSLVRRGDLRLMEQLLDDGLLSKSSLRNPSLYLHPARQGRHDILTFLFNQNGGLLPEEKTLRPAVLSGNVLVVHWITSLGIPVSPSAILDSASAGHVDVLKYLLDNFLVKITDAAMTAAATNGNLGCFRLLHQAGHTTAKLDRAAANGHLSILEYAQENNLRCAITHIGVDAALANGHVAVAKFIWQEWNVSCTDTGIIKSFGCGQVESATFLCNMAIEHVEWAPGDINTSDKAFCECLSNGHFAIGEMMMDRRWVKASGCMQEMSIQVAIASCADVDTAKRYVQRAGNMVKWFPQVILSACQQNTLDMVRFLHEKENVPLSMNAVRSAASRGNYEMVRYIIGQCEDSSAVVSIEAVVAACLSGSLKCFKLLVETAEEHDFVLGRCSDLFASAVGMGYYRICSWMLKKWHFRVLANETESPQKILQRLKNPLARHFAMTNLISCLLAHYSSDLWLEWQKEMVHHCTRLSNVAESICMLEDNLAGSLLVHEGFEFTYLEDMKNIRFGSSRRTNNRHSEFWALIASLRIDVDAQHKQ